MSEMPHTLEEEIDAFHLYIHELREQGHDPLAIGVDLDSRCVQHGVTSICNVEIYVKPESELAHVFDGL